MSEIEIRHVIIRGRVQGIGYRAWTQHEAKRRSLNGWVRNRRDGSVEAVLAGSADAIAGMIAACRIGPPGSRIDKIEERGAVSDEVDMKKGEAFAILSTV